MATEGGVYISDLDSAKPATGESPTDGDDHLRLIKSTVKATFPNINGAVSATQAELNLIDGSSAGTVAASKAVIYGASGEVNATTLQIGAVSITASAAEINLIDGSVAGTAVASKAVIYGSKKQVVATNFSTAEYNAGNSGTSITIDFDNGVNQKIALTGNVGITLSNPLAGQTTKLKITTNASSTYTVTFSTTVLWPGGVAYSASASGSKVDIVTLYYDGTAWYGQAANGFA